MRRVLWVVAIVLLFSSCRTGRQVVVVEARDSVRVEERVREIKVYPRQARLRLHAAVSRC